MSTVFSWENKDEEYGFENIPQVTCDGCGKDIWDEERETFQATDKWGDMLDYCSSECRAEHAPYNP